MRAVPCRPDAGMLQLHASTRDHGYVTAARTGWLGTETAQFHYGVLHGAVLCLPFRGYEYCHG